MSDIDCQYKRCPGIVDIQAVGIDEQGQPTQMGTCRRCGRITTFVPHVEQDALPGLEVDRSTSPSHVDSADARRTRRRRELLDRGIHPATGLPLSENGETCGTCAHLRGSQYRKCGLVPMTRGPGTDLRVSWPSCTRWEAVTADG